MTGGLVAIVDDTDYDHLTRHKWHAIKVNQNHYARRMTKVEGKWKALLMHRVVTNAPAGTEVHHDDRNGLHNWRKNLIVATHTDHMRLHRITPEHLTITLSFSVDQCDAEVIRGIMRQQGISQSDALRFLVSLYGS